MQEVVADGGAQPSDTSRARRKFLDTIKAHKDELADASENYPFIVFLCGPTMKGDNLSPAALLRKRLKDELERNKFHVVLGEDDGLEDARLGIGVNAQDNELEYIRKHCGAVIIIAGSVGSFCELGLFSWHFAHQDGTIRNGSNADIILVVDKQYQDDKSYFNFGPVAAVEGYGQVHYVNYDEFTIDPILRRLVSRRGSVTVDRRGRPPKRRAS